MTDHERYRRQETSFSDERRSQTFIAEFGGECAGWASAFLKAGAAAAGAAKVWSDYHGSGGRARHWLLGNHDALARTVNCDVDYDYIDPGFLREDLEGVIACHGNSWLVVHAHDPALGLEALEQLADLRVRVVLTLAAPWGVVVERHPSPATALERLGELRELQTVPAGHAELAMVAAGMALNEIMLAGRSIRDDLETPRTVAFYSLYRRRRIDMPPGAALEKLVRELAEPPEPAVFSGRRITQVGAGALGNWTAIAVALDGHVTMDVIDGDPTVEAHNLNRQVLLVNGVGQPKAPVLTRELRGIDPAGTYRESARYVRKAADLEPLEGVDAVIMAPDNDAARLVGSDVTWHWAVPYGVGGTGATGGQLVIQQPGRACYRCVAGPSDEAVSPPDHTGGTSCIRANNESIVASNMVIAGLLVSELREALAGRRSQNLRFFGDGGGAGNRLGWMTSDPKCLHLALAGCKAGPCSLEV